MRDPNRIEPMLDNLGRLWKQYPDLRLGQLIENLGVGKSIFYMEDDYLSARILKAMGESND